MKKLVVMFMMVMVIAFGCKCEAGNFNEVTFSTTEWQDYTNTDGSGLYYDTVNAVFKSAGIKVNYKLRPYARAWSEFVDGEHDGIIGASEEEGTDTIIVSSEWPLEVGYISILSHSDNVYDNDKSFKGKTVGWVRGYAFEDYITLDVSEYKIYEFSNIDAGFRMVEKGRLDFILDYEADLAPAIEGSDGKYNLKNYMPETVVIAVPDNAKGREIMSIWNTHMKKLYDNGTLNKIFNDNGFGDYIKP